MLRVEELEPREVPSAGLGEGGNDAPELVDHVPAGIEAQWRDDWAMENYEYQISGKVWTSGGPFRAFVSPFTPDAHPLISIADGGEWVIKPWVIGEGGYRGGFVTLEGVPLVIKAGGKLTIERNPNELVTCTFTTDTYVLNFGTVHIDDNGRFAVTGSTGTGDEDFPGAGLYSTGAVEVQAGPTPGLFDPSQLAFTHGWYQSGGTVALAHNVADVLGPTSRPDVTVWSDVFMKNAAVFTGSAGLGSTGTGGLVVDGDLTLKDCTLHVRNSYYAGEGIDAIRADSITASGLTVYVVYMGTITEDWRGFLFAPGGVTITDPTFAGGNPEWWLFGVVEGPDQTAARIRYAGA